LALFDPRVLFYAIAVFQDNKKKQMGACFELLAFRLHYLYLSPN